MQACDQQTPQTMPTHAQTPILNHAINSQFTTTTNYGFILEK
jgi:hypothetical protein